mgnify:CR=1 FL=1
MVKLDELHRTFRQTVWIPVVYADCKWNNMEDGTQRTKRPENDTPIVGKSVNE